MKNLRNLIENINNKDTNQDKRNRGRDNNQRSRQGQQQNQNQQSKDKRHQSNGRHGKSRHDDNKKNRRQHNNSRPQTRQHHTNLVHNQNQLQSNKGTFDPSSPTKKGVKLDTPQDDPTEEDLNFISWINQQATKQGDAPQPKRHSLKENDLLNMVYGQESREERGKSEPEVIKKVERPQEALVESDNKDLEATPGQQLKNRQERSESLSKGGGGLADFSPIQAQSALKNEQWAQRSEKKWNSIKQRRFSHSPTSQKSSKNVPFEYKGFVESQPLTIKEQTAVQIKRNIQSYQMITPSSKPAAETQSVTNNKKAESSQNLPSAAPAKPEAGNTTLVTRKDSHRQNTIIDRKHSVETLKDARNQQSSGRGHNQSERPKLNNYNTLQDTPSHNKRRAGSRKSDRQRSNHESVTSNQKMRSSSAKGRDIADQKHSKMAEVVQSSERTLQQLRQDHPLKHQPSHVSNAHQTEEHAPIPTYQRQILACHNQNDIKFLSPRSQTRERDNEDTDMDVIEKPQSESICARPQITRSNQHFTESSDVQMPKSKQEQSSMAISESYNIKEKETTFAEDAEMQGEVAFSQNGHDGAQEDSSRLKEFSQKVPFYILEQMERNKRVLYKKKMSFDNETEQTTNVQAQFLIIERFINVSKVILNRFVYFLQIIKCQYLNIIKNQSESLKKILLRSTQEFASETQLIFINVLKAQMSGYQNVEQFLQAQQAQAEESIEETKQDSENKNGDQINRSENSQRNVDSEEGYNGSEPIVNFTSMKHCIKRILKASKIQLDDFEWKNGLYQESSFASAAHPKSGDFHGNKEILQHRMGVLQELMEMEQVSKQYLDLYKRNFVLVFELLKHDVMDLILAEEDEEIESNMSHSHNPANHDNEFELKMRMRGCYLRYVNYQNFVDAFCNGNFKPKKLINQSILDVFTKEEVNQINQQNTLMISLLEIGNTIDGVTITSKLLKKKHKRHQNSVLNLSTFQNWKKRKCHCCMEYILDAGKAVTCVNLINQRNTCKNLYCQACVVAFMEQYHNYKVPNQCIENTSQQSQEDRAVRQREEKKQKHKLWLKALQNVLFVCPCCQGYCLVEHDSSKKERTFSRHSVCNFNHRMLNHPTSFLKTDFFWNRMTSGKNKRFQMARIIGLIKNKSQHKVEILSNSQILQIQLSREEIFFPETVKQGSKLFKIIEEQGFELDLKSGIEKQIKDFQMHTTYSILEKYKNFVEKCDLLNDGFVIPKFVNNEQSSRADVLKDFRELYKRYDNQLFETFDYDSFNLLDEQSCTASMDNSEGEISALAMNRYYNEIPNDQSSNMDLKPKLPRELRNLEIQQTPTIQANKEKSQQLSETQEQEMVRKSQRIRTNMNYKVLNEKGMSHQDLQKIEVEQKFAIEKSTVKGTAKTPFEALKCVSQNIKNTPYELTMEPTHPKKKQSESVSQISEVRTKSIHKEIKSVDYPKSGQDSAQGDGETSSFKMEPGASKRNNTTSVNRSALAYRAEANTFPPNGVMYPTYSKTATPNHYANVQSADRGKQYSTFTPNVGLQMVLEKNIQMAKDCQLGKQEDKLQLLITKEVFRIEKHESKHSQSVDAIGEIKPLPPIFYPLLAQPQPPPKPRTTNVAVKAPAPAKKQPEPFLFDVEKGASRDVQNQPNPTINEDESSQDGKEELEHREFKITKIGQTATITFKDGNEPSEPKTKSNAGRKGRRLPKDMEMIDLALVQIKQEIAFEKGKIKDSEMQIENAAVESIEKDQNQEEKVAEIDQEMKDEEQELKSQLEDEVLEQEEVVVAQADKNEQTSLLSDHISNEKMEKSEKGRKLEVPSIQLPEQELTPEKLDLGKNGNKEESPSTPRGSHSPTTNKVSSSPLTPLKSKRAKTKEKMRISLEKQKKKQGIKIVNLNSQRDDRKAKREEAQKMRMIQQREQRRKLVEKRREEEKKKNEQAMKEKRAREKEEREKSIREQEEKERSEREQRQLEKEQAKVLKKKKEDMERKKKEEELLKEKLAKEEEIKRVAEVERLKQKALDEKIKIEKEKMREKKKQDEKRAQEEKSRREMALKNCMVLEEMQKLESSKGQKDQEQEVDTEEKDNKSNSPKGRSSKNVKIVPKKPVQGKEGAAATIDQVEADYLKALEIDERKEYNLRRNTTTRNPPAKVVPPKVKINTDQQLTQQKVKAEEVPVGPTTRRTRQGGDVPKPKEQIEEGFFDDFPADIIKLYKLKVSQRVRDEIFPGRKKKQQTVEPSRARSEKSNSAVIEPLSKRTRNSSLLETPAVGTASKAVEESKNSNAKKVTSPATVSTPAEAKNVQQGDKTIGTSEPPKNALIDSTEQAVKNDKLFLKRFVISPDLEKHYQQLQAMAINNPNHLIGFYVYIYNQDKNLWKRAFIKDCYPYSPANTKTREYQIILQNYKRQAKKLDLLSVKFIIDQRRDDDKMPRKALDEPKKSISDDAKMASPAAVLKQQVPSTPVKAAAASTAAAALTTDKSESGRNPHNKQITQLMNYQGFNNKKRVHKMIKKIEEQQENEMKKVGVQDQTPTSEKEEEPEPSQVSNAQSHNEENADMEDAKSEDVEDDQSNQLQEAEAAPSLHETDGSHESVDKQPTKKQEKVVPPTPMVTSQLKPAPKSENSDTEDPVIEIQMNGDTDHKQHADDVEVVDLISKDDGSDEVNNAKVKVVEEATEEVIIMEKMESSNEMKEPKKEWIQDMKVQLLSKTRESGGNTKVLKFYHEPLLMNDWTETSDDFEQIPNPPKKLNVNISLSANLAPATENGNQQQAISELFPANMAQQKQIFPPENFLKPRTSLDKLNAPIMNQQAMNFSSHIGQLNQLDQLNNAFQSMMNNQSKIQNDYQINNDQQLREHLMNLPSEFIKPPPKPLFPLEQSSQQIPDQQQSVHSEETIDDNIEVDSAKDMLQQKLLLTRLQQKSFLIEQQKQKLQEQIEHMQQNGLDEQDNTKAHYEQISYEYEQLCIMQSFMEQIYQQQVQAYIMRQELDGAHQKVYKILDSGDQQNQDMDHMKPSENRINENEDLVDDLAINNQFQNQPNLQHFQLLQNGTQDKNQMMLSEELERLNQMQQLQIEHASKSASQQVMNQYYHDKLKKASLYQQNGQFENGGQEAEQIEIEKMKKYYTDNIPRQNENSQNLIEMNDDGTAPNWKQQYYYLQKVQQILDRIDKLNGWDINDPEAHDDKMEEALATVEDGIAVLEDGYSQERQIEGLIAKMFQIHRIATLDNAELEQGFDVASVEHSNEEVEHQIDCQNEDEPENQLDSNMKSVKLDFFINHIENLNQVKKEKKGQKLKEVNDLDNLQPNEPARRTLEMPQNEQVKKDLRRILKSFYQKMIVLNGFKKCKCQACFKMVYPLLVKYDVDSSLFSQEHLDFQRSQPDTSEHIELSLKQILNTQKSDLEIRNTIQVLQKRIADSEAEINSETIAYEVQNPCFGLLIKKMAEEESSKIEGEPERKDGEFRLPKLSQVMLSAAQVEQAEGSFENINEKFQQQLDNMLKQRRDKIVESAEIGTPTKKFEAQIEIDLMRTMQKMLVQFKLLSQIPTNASKQWCKTITGRTNGTLKSLMRYHAKESSSNNVMGTKLPKGSKFQRLGKNQKIIDNQLMEAYNETQQNAVYQNFEMNQNQNQNQQQPRFFEPQNISACDQPYFEQQENNQDFRQMYGLQHQPQYRMMDSMYIPSMYDQQQITMQPPNFNSNFNNCQIFQPQIINQNYLQAPPPPLQQQYQQYSPAPNQPAEVPPSSQPPAAPAHRQSTPTSNQKPQSNRKTPQPKEKVIVQIEVQKPVYQHHQPVQALKDNKAEQKHSDSEDFLSEK